MSYDDLMNLYVLPTSAYPARACPQATGLDSIPLSLHLYLLSMNPSPLSTWSDGLRLCLCCFLCFRDGILPSLPGMILPGWTILSKTSASSIGSESRQYWYASWLGIVLVRPLEYSQMRKMMRTCVIRAVNLGVSCLREGNTSLQ